MRLPSLSMINTAGAPLRMSLLTLSSASATVAYRALVVLTPVRICKPRDSISALHSPSERVLWSRWRRSIARRADRASNPVSTWSRRATLARIARRSACDSSKRSISSQFNRTTSRIPSISACKGVGFRDYFSADVFAVEINDRIVALDRCRRLSEGAHKRTPAIQTRRDAPAVRRHTCGAGHVPLDTAGPPLPASPFFETAGQPKSRRPCRRVGSSGRLNSSR